MKRFLSNGPSARGMEDLIFPSISDTLYEKRICSNCSKDEMKAFCLGNAQARF